MSVVKRVVIRAQDGSQVTLDSSEPTDGWALAEATSSNMEGWWEAPRPRAEAIDRPGASGAFAPAQLLTGPRVLTINAHHAASSEEDELRARSLISSITRQWVQIIVTEAGRTTHVRAFLSAQAKIEHWEDEGSTWSMIFTCPDPLKYEGNGASPGQAGSAWKLAEYAWRDGGGGALFKAFDQSPRQDVTTSNQPRLLFTGVQSLALEVDNTGGVPAWPVLEAVGPLRRMSWKLNGHVVEWNRPVPARALLRIDTKTGEVTINGSRERLSGLSEDDFFALPVGKSIVALDMDQPAMARVRWLQAWM